MGIVFDPAAGSGDAAFTAWNVLSGWVLNAEDLVQARGRLGAKRQLVQDIRP
jgi:hypothetical protein